MQVVAMRSSMDLPS